LHAGERLPATRQEFSRSKQPPSYEHAVRQYSQLHASRAHPNRMGAGLPQDLAYEPRKH
jgi:hypothetical protein